MDIEQVDRAFVEFREDLARALAHLYNPTYVPEQRLRHVLHMSDADSSATLRQMLAAAMEALRPPAEMPRASPPWRMHEVLACRYLLLLNHKETAARLGISQRHLSREQVKAVDWLARHLWEQSQPGRILRPVIFNAASDIALPSDELEDVPFRNQVRQELSALYQSMPDATADIGEAIQGLASLWPVIAPEPSMELRLQPVEAGLLAAVHPSLLRQLLLAALGDAAADMAAGDITVTAAKTEHQVRVRFAGRPAEHAAEPSQGAFLQEMLQMVGGTFAAAAAAGSIVLEIGLPVAERVKVLVIDDNVDLVHFYRRYVQGTRYSIVDVQEGNRALAAMAAHNPDVIILDVMLPDIDGWQLLIDLQQQTVMRVKPIIVCSVVKQERLALALGAALFVAKPVRRQEFIDALDHAAAQRT